MVLGRPDRHGRWKAVGLLSQPLSPGLRPELANRLRPRGNQARLPGIISDLPGSDQVAYQPTRPEIVIEIQVDSALKFGRYRHRPAALRLLFGIGR